MKYAASIGAKLKRDRNLQTVRKSRNKMGKFVGRVVIKMRNSRVNGKAGRYAATQGKK